ncbi:hypothetical protein Hamer_G023102 [Homarus americanus]|uniref:Uncharacterized protein n=1 Tax=Homarus americanus TaxID=6706 RepID=A0A8J5JRK4_HOMAM|nr:hypothetical protein Hamer_G027196 [Homarus americanus]KAG7171686.1 hypothetical protein Hamer_G023102 [Homarus americanus]
MAKLHPFPSLVTEEDTEELLGVSATTDGTGEQVTVTVMKGVRGGGVEPRTSGMGFDTTAPNTGMIQSVCIRFEEKLGRPLLWQFLKIPSTLAMELRQDLILASSKSKKKSLAIN